MSKKHFVVVSGSRRHGSYNTTVAKMLVDVVQDSDEVSAQFHAVLNVPFYDADVEEQGFPQPVQELAAAIAAADGMIIVTPEYNGYFSGTLLNVLDWMSRSINDKKVLVNKPLAIMGVSPGGNGAVRALEQTKHMGVNLKMRVFPTTMGIGSVHTLFDDENNCIDDKTRQKTRQFVESFAAWIQ